jgi:hypothetical protein
MTPDEGNKIIVGYTIAYLFAFIALVCAMYALGASL